MNIVLLTVDCLRADRLHPDSSSDVRAPFLNELGREGVTFESAFATGPATSYSMPGLMTGTYPSWFGGYPPIPDEIKTIPEVMDTNGFRAIGLHSNPWLDSAQGFAKGFEEYVDLEAPDPETSDARAASDGLTDRLMDRLTSMYHEIPSARIKQIVSTIYYAQHYRFSSKQNSAEHVATRAIEEIDHADGDDLFLWAHFMDLHRPYTVLSRNEEVSLWHAARVTQPDYTNPSPANSDRIISLYDSNLSYIDENIRRIHKAIQQSDDGYLLVITSDHGEEFGEHGDWFHGSFNLYDELIRVPLLISGPNTSGESFEEIVSLTDIGPTLFEYADIELPSNFIGNSLDSSLSGGPTPDRTTICSEVYGPHREKVAVRSTEWKYIHHKDGDDELYNLTEDPEELDNRYSSMEIPADIRSAFERYMDNKQDASEPAPEPELRDRLKNLGYLE